MLEEVSAIVGVDRGVEGAELVKGEPCQDELEPVAHHHCDAVATGHAEVRQAGGQAVAQLVRLRISDRRVVDRER